jgi:hypothetical protein
MSHDPYRFVRERRPDLYRKVIEVGLAVTCAPKSADSLTRGAKAENRAMEIVADILREQEGETT